LSQFWQNESKIGQVLSKWHSQLEKKFNPQNTFHTYLAVTSIHQSTNLVLPNFILEFFSVLTVEKEKKKIIGSKKVFFECWTDEKFIFFFNCSNWEKFVEEKFVEEKWGKQNWWFDVTKKIHGGSNLHDLSDVLKGLKSVSWWNTKMTCNLSDVGHISWVFTVWHLIMVYKKRLLSKSSDFFLIWMYIK